MPDEEFYEGYDRGTHTEEMGRAGGSYTEFYATVGRIISPAYDHLLGAVSAANFGEGRRRELYQRAVSLAEELGEWDLYSHFSRREGRIDELTERIKAFNAVKEGTDKKEDEAKSPETKAVVAMLNTHSKSERDKLCDEKIEAANAEIRTLQAEIERAVEQDSFEDYSYVEDIFDEEAKHTVGQRQMKVPYYIREHIALCRATEDNTKNTHEEASLARLIAYNNMEEMAAQRKVQPRARRSSSATVEENDF